MDFRFLITLCLLAFALWLIRRWVRSDSTDDAHDRRRRKVLSDRIFNHRHHESASDHASDHASNHASNHGSGRSTGSGSNEESLGLQSAATDSILSASGKYQRDTSIDSRVQDLESNNKRLNEELETQRVIVDDLNVKLAKAKVATNEISARDEEILSLKNELQELQYKLEQRAQALSRNEVELAFSSEKLVSLQATEGMSEEYQSRIRQLSESLANAEKQHTEAKQNDSELRRLRSELESLSREKNQSNSRISDLEKRLVEQAQSVEHRRQASSVNMDDNQRLKAARFETDKQLEVPRKQQDGVGKSASEALSATNTTTAQPTKPDSQSNTPRTPLYVAPKERDNLKQIKGIGPVMEKVLNELGVTSFKQLAEFTQQDIEKVSAAIGAFPGRIERDDWVGKAREHYKRKYGETT